MMCKCDEEFGTRFLPHQLRQGTELHTQRRVAVTAGFQQKTCATCRGLPEPAAPKAAMRGATSNFRRYYWREIFMETTRRFAHWADENGVASDVVAQHLRRDEYQRIEKEVVADLKRQHEISPKYHYENVSSADVIKQHSVEMVELHATFRKTISGRALPLDGQGNPVTPESFVITHFEELGYRGVEMESRPVHALFAVMMRLVVEDPADKLGRMAQFGSRTAFEEGRRGPTIWVNLPEDFGSPGYGERRADAITKHINSIPDDRREWLWTFDYLAMDSWRLREYLWAHKQEDLERAKLLIKLLPLDALRRILLYLSESYWARYLGWPDLLEYTAAGDYFFCEVKASSDQLSDEQKSWIAANATRLQLPFKLAKIHRDRVLAVET